MFLGRQNPTYNEGADYKICTYFTMLIKATFIRSIMIICWFLTDTAAFILMSNLVMDEEERLKTLEKLKASAAETQGMFYGA